MRDIALVHINCHYYLFSGLNIGQYAERLVCTEILPFLPSIYHFYPVFTYSTLLLPTVR